MRKVLWILCKSFVQWFRELYLCSYKYRVDCFDSLRFYFFVAVEVKVQRYNKTLNVRSLGKLVIFVFPRVLMFPSTSSRKTSGFSGKQRYLFPSGSDITAVTTNTRPQSVFHWVQTCGDVHENSGFNREKKTFEGECQW